MLSRGFLGEQAGTVQASLGWVPARAALIGWLEVGGCSPGVSWVGAGWYCSMGEAGMEISQVGTGWHYTNEEVREKRSIGRVNQHGGLCHFGGTGGF